MSFKREGSDTNLLGILKKRRIKDLLSEDIPEDEAKLLSNGRFACMVCSNHPIFDTVNMLTVHRHGKKHQHYQEIHESKKKELKYLIRKRQQEEILKYGKSSIKMATAQGKSGIHSSPYNPCVKKGQTKVGAPRPRLDLSKCEASPSATETPDNVANTSSSTRSDDHATWRNTCQQQIQGPVVHSRQLKDIFSQKPTMHQRNDPVRVTPYQSKAPRRAFHPTTNATTFAPSASGFPTYYDHSANSSYLDGPLSEPSSTRSRHSQGSFQNSNEFKDMSTMNDGYSGSHLHHEILANSSTLHGGGLPTTAGSSSQTKSGDRIVKSAKQNMPHQRSKPNSGSQNPASSSSNQKSLTSEGGDTELAAKYRLLQGSGWKKDWDGKWIRDEEAEFDSDEEPPDLP